MKNEDRIVELLAESLKNQDIQSEKLSTFSRNQEIQNQKLDIQSEKLEKVSSKIYDLVDVVKDLGKAMQSQVSIMERLINKYDKVDDLEHRIFLLEKKIKD